MTITHASTRTSPVVGVIGTLTVATVAAGLLLPDITGDAGAMTHYMGLLASNQPWNLLIFMAVPVVLAEILAVTELVVLFARTKAPDWVVRLNRNAGLLAGPWFAGIFVYLFKNAVIPLTMHGAWHGLADLIAVFAYLSGLVPLMGIALLEAGVIGRNADRLKLHATFVGVFLVVAHVAMIFGMLDPALLGWMADGASATHM